MSKAENHLNTHEKISLTADQIETLADRIFVCGLRCRREDLLIASALLRRLSLDGNVEELHVWRLDGEAE